MLDVLHFEFMRNALTAGLFTSIICGIIGTLVVVNRIAFLSGGIAHSAYGGIGMAFFFNWPYLPTTIGFSMVMAMIMAWVTIKARHRSDTIIGVIWAVGMALGVILLDLSPGYNVDLMSYLFGSIISVTNSDIRIMIGISVLIFLITSWFYRDLTAISYDDEFARLRGVPVNLLYFLMICMVAVSIVIIIRVVGLILVIALLTIPPYIAEKYSHSLFKMMLISGFLSMVFCFSGLWLSYKCNLTSGASIIMVAGAGFLISFFIPVRKYP